MSDPQNHPAHIAIFVPSMRGGGAERVMLNLAHYFAAQGHRVDLVLAQREGPLLDQVQNGIRLIDLQSPRVLTSLPALVRYLRRERPDALLSAMNHANIVAVWARMLARVPLRLVISERSTMSVDLSYATGLSAKLIPMLARWTYPRADDVVAVSEGVAHDLRQRGLTGQNLRVIYNPSVTPDLVAKAQQPPTHRWLTAKDGPIILSVGRLTPAKDFATLVQASGQIIAKRPVRMIIVGEGELRQDLEAQIAALGIQDRVDLPGYTDNPYVYMRHADVFVLSSKWEGFPNVIVEALACGCPVVSTDCPFGPREILGDGRYGSLVPVGDSEALAEAILQMLDNPVDMADLQRRASAFSMDVIGQQYLDVLLKQD